VKRSYRTGANATDFFRASREDKLSGGVVIAAGEVAVESMLDDLLTIAFMPIPLTPTKGSFPVIANELDDNSFLPPARTAPL
jgi:hypothetical protein